MEILLPYVVTGEWVALAIPQSLGEPTFDVFLYARTAVPVFPLAFLAFSQFRSSQTKSEQSRGLFF
ncbi:MAG: hypothetical protein QW767_01320 [Thermoprotei archaeon]